jgi:hypothetical protein
MYNVKSSLVVDVNVEKSDRWTPVEESVITVKSRGAYQARNYNDVYIPYK